MWWWERRLPLYLGTIDESCCGECERDISKRLSSYPLEKKNKTRFSWTPVMFWNMYNKCCGPAWWWCLGHETLNSLSSSVHCCPARTERRLKGRRRRRKKNLYMDEWEESWLCLLIFSVSHSVFFFFLYNRSCRTTDSGTNSSQKRRSWTREKMCWLTALSVFRLVHPFATRRQTTAKKKVEDRTRTRPSREWR